MTEQELWAYFKALRKGSEHLDSSDRLPKEEVVKLGEWLLSEKTSPKAKDIIMMTLAHQQRSKEALKYLNAYNRMQVDEGMKIYTQIAVEECEWWNE